MQELFERAEGPEGIKALEVVADNPDDYSKKVKDAVIIALSIWRKIEPLKAQFSGLMALAKEEKAYSQTTLKTLKYKIIMSNIFGLLASDPIESKAYDVQALTKLRSLIADGDKLDKSDLERVRLEMVKLKGSRLIGKWDSKELTTRSIKKLFKCRKAKKGPKGERVDATKVIGVYDFRTILKINNMI